jgi:pectate lyase
MSRRVRLSTILTLAFALVVSACSGPSDAISPVDTGSTSDEPGGTTAELSVAPPGTIVRFDVPDAPAGFAQTQGLTGGFGLAPYVVDSADDVGAGSYRDALSRGDRHITFGPSMDGRTISLTRDVLVEGSNITLDGSGVDITITGYATKFSGTNIVVAGMAYVDNDTLDDEDALTFVDASETQVVGLFGNLFSHASDGLVDFIWNRGNDVYATVCGNRFERHDKAMLIHSGRESREGGTYHITMCHNVWSDIYQRAPLSRDAYVHQYNSVFERYGKVDGSGGGSKAGFAAVASQHLLEGNIAIPRAEGERTFDGGITSSPRPEWAGPHNGQKGAVRINGSLLETVDGLTATEVEQFPSQVLAPPYDAPVAIANPATRDAVAATAGQCVPAGAGHIVPCAPLLLLERGDRISVTVDAAVTGVRFELDGVQLESPTADGAGTWTVTFANLTDRVGTLRAIATTADGMSVTSDPVNVAVVS